MAVKAYAPVALLCVFWLGGALAIAADGEVEAVRRQAARWRTERRIVDLHQHVGYTAEFLGRDVKIMDAVGVGLVVNLDGGTVTPTTSLELADLILDQAEVAVVPGEAFGPSGYIRMSYALGDEQLLEGVRRLQHLFSA